MIPLFFRCGRCEISPKRTFRTSITDTTSAEPLNKQDLPILALLFTLKCLKVRNEWLQHHSEIIKWLFLVLCFCQENMGRSRNMRDCGDDMNQRLVVVQTTTSRPSEIKTCCLTFEHWLTRRSGGRKFGYNNSNRTVSFNFVILIITTFLVLLSGKASILLRVIRFSLVQLDF